MVLYIAVNSNQYSLVIMKIMVTVISQRRLTEIERGWGYLRVL